MTHPRSAFGAAPSRGQHVRPGEAGSAVFAGLRALNAPQRCRLAGRKG
jgi:hypothetical protein